MKEVFLLRGRVLKGKGMGRNFGFPTANLAYERGHEYPPDGVYAAIVTIDGEEGEFFAMLNQGGHPTVPGGSKTIEVHLLSYSGALYGRMVNVKYLRFLREERRFDSLEALKRQLAVDAENAFRALTELPK